MSCAREALSLFAMSQVASVLEGAALTADVRPFGGTSRGTHVSAKEGFGVTVDQLAPRFGPPTDRTGTQLAAGSSELLDRRPQHDLVDLHIRRCSMA